MSSVVLGLPIHARRDATRRGARGLPRQRRRKSQPLSSADAPDAGGCAARCNVAATWAPTRPSSREIPRFYPLPLFRGTFHGLSGFSGGTMREAVRKKSRQRRGDPSTGLWDYRRARAFCGRSEKEAGFSIMPGEREKGARGDVADCGDSDSCHGGRRATVLQRRGATPRSFS